MIYLECDADKALVRTLGIPRKEIRHEGDKGRVCNRLRKAKDAIELVDEDPRSAQPPYLQTLTPRSNEHGIKVLHDERAGNYLLVLCPRLEQWILNAAREAKVDVGQYGLPDDEDHLHKHINNKLEHFEKLLDDLVPKSAALKVLKGLLKT